MIPHPRRAGDVQICMTNAAQSFETETLPLAAQALLVEIRTLTASGGVYPNPEKDSALDVLLDELIHGENLVEPNPVNGEGWIAVDPE
jgi:hypothetical protein